jgi:hypothetical protein
MSDFKRLRENGCFYGYYDNTKLSNGQTAAIFFFDNCDINHNEFSVSFIIANKKKDINGWLHGEKDLMNNQQTGKCGLEGLIWAKKKLLEFEAFINESVFYKNSIMVIYWTNNKRRDVYEKALSKIGYYITYRNSYKCLVKKL